MQIENVAFQFPKRKSLAVQLCRFAVSPEKRNSSLTPTIPFPPHPLAATCNVQYIQVTEGGYWGAMINDVFSYSVHVVHGILEENKVHHSIDLIVGLQGFLQDPVECLPGGHREVLGLSDARGKVAVDKRLFLQHLLIKVLGKEVDSN